MNATTPLIAAALALAVAACGMAAAAPRGPEPVAQSATAPAAPAASVLLVQRLDAQTDHTLADVTGLTVRRARAQLSGLAVSVVSFGKGRVSAQWPPAGDPHPADGAVVVWVGTPPTPPSAAPVPPGAGVTTGPGQQPPGTTTASQPGGVTPGLEDFVPPPHPPRSNIRELPPASAGTQLTGRASWYGPGFAGHRTACGTVFDPSQHTLASRELRCGTEVTVTGPSGRSVHAVVTDWGPAEWTERRFDLSQATFAAVAGLGSGVVDVTIEVR